MGFSAFGIDIGTIIGEVASWFGGGSGADFTSQVGNIEFYQRRGSQIVRNLPWDDWLQEDIPENAQVVQQSYFPLKKGYLVQLVAEFAGDGANAPASGTAFLCHATESVFDRMVMTLSGVPLEDISSSGSGWSVRLVQRDEDDRQVFVSGAAEYITEDGVIYRTNSIIPAFASYSTQEEVGGPIQPGLPMFVVCEPYGNFAGLSDVGDARVQVTVNLLSEPVP